MSRAQVNEEIVAEEMKRITGAVPVRVRSHGNRRERSIHQSWLVQFEIEIAARLGFR